ncbi:mortality factor 4-like protein 2 isoform X2 [Echinops telfairi]|uniref:Mortality factor 4-like protein 2 n=1 Tax=Echinops telfairi TaxID=9371 RepID=A0ABM0J3S4_ECHTE|nr:mortality factor 4-like protein 2 isoform X2 [Echinops telfairi]
MRRAASEKKTASLQQKNLEKTRKKKQKNSGNRNAGSTSKEAQPPSRKRAGADPTIEKKKAFEKCVKVKGKIPKELKAWLIEDWDLVTRQKQLFQLPAKKNVEAILDEYANYKRHERNVDHKECAVNEVVAAIKQYFNVMLDTHLLYEFEKPQYAQILMAHPDVPMSQIYGAPYLLRLFVKLCEILALKPFDGKSLSLLLGYLHDILKYLAENRSALFTANDYKVPSGEYHHEAL